MRMRTCAVGVLALLLAGAGMALAAAETAPAAKDGTMVGTVAEKGETWIRVTDADGKSERFSPRWVGGNEGGFDKDMLKKIDAAKLKATVVVKWVRDERMRVVELTVEK